MTVNGLARTGSRLAAAAALCLVAACTAPAPPRSHPGAATATAGTTACEEPQGPAPAETPTTIDVVEDAYHCVLANHYAGATLDPRTLLAAAFAALTRELNRDGRDLPEATLPALTGDRRADWAAFEAVYRRIADRLPDDTGLRERLSAAALDGMVASLDDNHARWTHGVRRPLDQYDDDLYGLGLRASVSVSQVTHNPGTALPPLFVTAVLGGPAKDAGLRPGDVIESVNGSPPFAGDAVTPAAVAALSPAYPEADPVRLRLRRPGTGRTRTVTLKPRVFRPDPEAMRQVVPEPPRDGVARVRLAAFAPDAAKRVLDAIAAARGGRALTGVVLDLRGNGGGSPDEVNRLLGAFAHGEVTAYLCAADGECRAERTDDTVPLLGLPLVVLVDRGCASACEHFAAAVKDLGLGRLVGTRTAGAVSGPARRYLLGNGTFLSLPSRRHLGPGREPIDRIGVAPDHHVPLTAEDAAAGRDPALAKALTLLPG